MGSPRSAYRRMTVVYLPEDVDKMIKALVKKYSVFAYTSRNSIMLRAVKLMYEKELVKTKAKE